MKRLTISFLAVLILASTGSGTEGEFQYYLPVYSFHQFDNGFQLILVENHTNPLIATIVVTRTGLRNETAKNNGVSHMLEHLTFNGTEKRTQKQLYDELDYYGIYLNAQTSEDYTTYMALNHKDQFKNAIDIMSDMLFQSTFPMEKFEKEKGIIAEEIRKDSENPDFKKEQALRQAFYKEPPYSLPVIGSVSSVEKMTRQQVINYYETYYSPNNMIAMVVGDFDSSEMVNQFQDYFGKIPAKNIPKNVITLDESFPFFYSEAGENDQTLYLKVPAPTFYSQYFIPFQFYYDYTFDEHSGKIVQALKNQQQLGIQKLSPTYEYHPEFGILTLKITFSANILPETVQNAVIKEFERVQSMPFSDDEIKNIKRSTAISEILQTDKILYYGFLKAQELAVGGLDAFQSLIPGTMQEKPKNIKQLMQSYHQLWATPQRLFASTDWPSRINVEKFRKKTVVREKGESRIFQHTFPNGLKTLLLRNEDNSVLALHFLFKNRSAWEPVNQTGIADFLHHSIFKSSRNYSRDQLQTVLMQIGAEIKAYDWDFIPYDDYYNVPEYSYIRILTLDQFFEQTMAIASDNIIDPDLTSQFDDVKKQMQMLASRRQDNARNMSYLNFAEMLFGKGHPLARPVSGTPATIDSISPESLKAFHRKYFTAGNTILSIVSSLDSSTVFSAVGKYFSKMPVDSAYATIPGIHLTRESAADSMQIGSQQSYINLGYTFSAPDSLEIPLEVMNNILSTRMAFSLREQKGWAYRLGTSINRWKNHFYFDATMGTGRATTIPAIQGIKDEMNIFRDSTLEQRSLERTKNSMMASLVRRRASRENQAYVLGLNSFLDYPTDYFYTIYKKIKNVPLNTVSYLRENYLSTNPAILFYTIPGGDKGQKQKMPGMPSKTMH
jgi:zinc protease